MGFFTLIGGGIAKGARWLLENPAILLAGAFGIMFAMVVVSKNSEIATLEKASKDKDVRLERNIATMAQLRGNNATLNASLTTQSASIKALEAQGTTASARFDQIMAATADQTKTLNAKIVSLDSAKPGANKCDSALALVRSNVQ